MEKTVNDEYNMSMRKFLKQVGVTSQKAIEEALSKVPADGRSYRLKAVLSCEELGLHHEVTGEIKAQE